VQMLGRLLEKDLIDLPTIHTQLTKISG